MSILSALKKRKRSDVDWSQRSYSGLALKQNFYFNILERYSRYLELKLFFYNYERLSDIERERLANEATPTEIIKTDDGFTHIKGGECRFGCDAVPCSCTESWIELNNFRAEFEGKKLANILAIMDKDSFYRTVEN